jgi:hypothetical protein
VKELLDMARENQGLQIALIIFVMLTVALGASTYWVYRLYDEQANKAKSAASDAMNANNLANKTAKDVEDLKRLIDVPKTDAIDVITNTFNDDMKSYGGAYPETARFYRPLLEKMAKTIREKNQELVVAADKVHILEAEYKKRQAEKDAQMKQFEERAAKAEQDKASEQSKYSNERDRITRDESKHLADLQAARKSFNENITKIEGKLQLAVQRVKKLLDENQGINEKIRTLTEGKMGAPNGEISWVNLRNGTVWINLGRADALSRQVTFGVYSAESTDVKASKASIEVTQILGDHLAEARILDDNISNPIIPGDKIFTPLWNSGEKRHFVLAGLMDLKGDGRNDLDTMLNVIKAGGGVVDCWIADSGKEKNKVQGAITVNTNCLILGPAPDEKGDPAQREAFTKILREADQYRLPKMQLADFLQRIGWKNMSTCRRWSATAAAPIPTTSAPSRTKESCGSPRAMSATSSRIASRQPARCRTPDATISSSRTEFIPFLLQTKRNECRFTEQAMDREFLGIRCRLIELAAALDRIDRNDGDAAADPRMAQVLRSLEILADRRPERAERVQATFSLPYDEKWRQQRKDE